MIDDAELLRRYADERSQDAFAELVRRRVNLVYSVALRQVGGDAHLAEDVTQRVFADLARKARTLHGRAVLSGWLCRSAQFAASDVVRAERRRRVREQEAELMNEISSNTESAADWEKFRPLLDQALGELADEDRDAVALRFFEERSFAEIGTALRLTEDAARKRVSRALDQLHGLLARRGVTSTTAALGIALANQAAMAAPVGLAASITSAAGGGGAAALGWLTFMSMSKLQIGIVGAVALAGATGYFLQAETNTNLRREIAGLRVPEQDVEIIRQQNRQLASTAAEVEMLRRDDFELKQLAERATGAKAALDEKARRAAAAVVVVAPAQNFNAAAEIDRLNREGNQLVEEFKSLKDKSNDPAITPETRANLSVAIAQKMEAIKAKQLAIKAIAQKAGIGAFPPQPAEASTEIRRSTRVENVPVSGTP